MKKIIFTLFTLLCTNAFGQKSFNDYAQFYPLGDDPNIRLMSSYTKNETILFEANPIIRFSVYNNFMKGLMNEKKHTNSWYFSFRPHIRMYTDNSLPVRTPSYRILLGTQHMFRLKTESREKENFWGLSLETGHYSNGQDGCTFSENFSDGSIKCDSIYNMINSSTDLSDIVNRKSGNFSTNLTEIILNFRTYDLDDDNLPLKSHSFNAGYVLYHNKFLGIGDFGGFTGNDIKIYGRHRFLFGYEYMKVLQHFEGKRISIKQDFELIYKPHESVNPIRSETNFTLYPFSKSKAIGFFVTYIYGHDNYNIRFVDSGNQFSTGLTWSQFPPFPLTGEIF